MECRGCGQVIDIAPGERVGFREDCPSCSTDLHSCAHCQHHDLKAYNGCRESSAERVSDPERGNRCDYFTPSPDSSAGSTPKATEPTTNPLDALFKKS